MSLIVCAGRLSQYQPFRIKISAQIYKSCFGAYFGAQPKEKYTKYRLKPFFFAKGSPFCKGSDEYRSSLFKFRKIKVFIDNAFSRFPSLTVQCLIFFRIRRYFAVDGSRFTYKGNNDYRVDFRSLSDVRFVLRYALLPGQFSKDQRFFDVAALRSLRHADCNSFCFT